MVSPSEEVSQPSSTPRLSVMSMKCLLHREPSRHFSLGKERNFSPKSLRLKARRSSTARPGSKTGLRPGCSPSPGWSEHRVCCADAGRALDMRRRGSRRRVGSEKPAVRATSRTKTGARRGCVSGAGAQSAARQLDIHKSDKHIPH